MPKYRDDNPTVERPPGSRAGELQRHSHRHEAIMLWLIQNPDCTLKECGRALGYSQTWLSLIINSDAFAEKFREMRDEYTGDALRSLGEKLEALANTSLDKLMDQLDEIEDPVFIRETAMKTLDRLGYGRSKGGVTVNLPPGSSMQLTTVDRSMLAQARANRESMQLHKAQERERAEEAANAIDGEFTDVSSSGGE